MKRSWRLLAFIVSVSIAARAAALTLAIPIVPPNIAGSWAVDVTRLPIPAEQRPKSVTITFTGLGGGKWRTNVDIVAADGTATHGIATYEPNGVAVPAEGSPEADMVAVTIPRNDVLVMALSKGGVPGSIRVFTVAADGQSLTETAVYFGRDGKPAMRPAYMSRVK